MRGRSAREDPVTALIGCRMALPGDVERPSPKEILSDCVQATSYRYRLLPLSVGIAMYLRPRANHLAPVLALRVFPRHASQPLPL